MITLIRPILFSFLGSDKVKRLIVDLLKQLAKSTDNSVDDRVVQFVEDGLFPKNWLGSRPTGEFKSPPQYWLRPSKEDNLSRHDGLE